MKNKNAALIIAAIMLITAVCGCSSGQDTSEQETATQPAARYVYPYTPDSPEWLECETLDDMVELCQIPEKELAAMDSATLEQAALDYPLFINAFAFNSMTSGMDSIFSYANVLQELERRSDAGLELLKAYERVNELTEDDLKQMIDVDHFRVANMEALLARESIYSQLSENELIQLEEAVAEKFREKREYPEKYGYSSPMFYDLLAEAQNIPGMLTSKYTITLPSGASIEVDKTLPDGQPEE